MWKTYLTCLRATQYFRPDWKIIALFFFLFFISIVIGLLQAWPMAILIDCVLTKTPRTDFLHNLFLYPLPHSMMGRVIGVVIIGMFLKLCQDSLTTAKNMLNNYINNFGVMRLRNELYRKHHLQRSELMYRLCNDVQGIQLIINVLMGAIISLVMMITTTCIMIIASPTLTLMAFSVVPPLVWANYHWGIKIHSKTIDAKEVDADMLASYGDNIAHFEADTANTAKYWLKLNWEQEKYWLFVRTVFTIAGAAVFLWGGYLVWKDQFAHPIPNGMTLGMLAVFMDYLGRLWEPLTKLTAIGADIQPGLAGAERVFDAID